MTVDQRPLTDRERQVLALLADGATKPAAATRLTVSLGCIKSTCDRIYRKLDVHNLAAAISVAYQRGLLAPDAQTETDLAVVRTLRMPGYRLALARTEDA